MMKNAIRLSLLFTLLILLNSCSKDEDETSSPAPEITGDVINYQGEPDSENQLLTEVFIDNTQTTTYYYGTTDSEGNADIIQSVVFDAAADGTIGNVVLDSEQRVNFIYYERDGAKLAEVHKFSYPESEVVNFMAVHRDWSTMEDSLVSFITVETDGEDFIPYQLYGKSNEALQDALVTGLGVLGVVAVIAGGAAISTATGIIAGLIAAGTFLSVANAEEPPLTTPNPMAPEAPVETLEPFDCDNSALTVTVGVDPGNVLVAIVNGDSESYTFYWSTDEINTGIIANDITAPGPGNYYVFVEDENGCLAFGSATIQEESSIDLYSDTWIMEVLNPCSFGQYDGEQTNYNFQFAENGTIQFTTTLIDGEDISGGLNTLPLVFELEGDQLSISGDYEWWNDTTPIDCGDLSAGEQTIFYSVSTSLSLNYNSSNENFAGTMTDVGTPDTTPPCIAYDFSHNCTSSVSIYRIE